MYGCNVTDSISLAHVQSWVQMHSHYVRHSQVLPPFKYGGARGNAERKTEYVSHPYSAELDQTRAVWACILPFGVLLHWDHPTIPCSHSDPFYVPSICAPGLSAGSEAEQEPSHYARRIFLLQRVGG